MSFEVTPGNGWDVACTQSVLQIVKIVKIVQILKIVQIVEIVQWRKIMK